jgi:hypothetical protein
MIYAKFRSYSAQCYIIIQCVYKSLRGFEKLWRAKKLS